MRQAPEVAPRIFHITRDTTAASAIAVTVTVLIGGLSKIRVCVSYAPVIHNLVNRQNERE
jgi:hypothetical protein